MSGLSENIHKILAAFYKPKGKKKKIIMIDQEFPSDYYVVKSQIDLKGGNHKTDLIEIPVDNYSWDKSMENIINTIRANKDETAMVSISASNYLTS